MARAAIDPKDTRFVAVEGDRLAKLLDVHNIPKRTSSTVESRRLQ
jgi:hypothetical protein